MKTAYRSDGPRQYDGRLEEFNECEQRFTFLTRERDDLLQSIAGTRSKPSPSSIRPPRGKIRTGLFHSINRTSPKPSTPFFGGGMARNAFDRAGQLPAMPELTSVGFAFRQAPANVLLLSRRAKKAMDRAIALLIAIFR